MHVFRLLRRAGKRRTALLAVTALVSSVAPLAVSHPSVADYGPPSIAFRVVEPDGSPVVRPVVMVSVFGPTLPYVRVLAGGAAGQVVVPFPADDPVASSQLAAGQAVSLLVQVFDKTPGSADINAAYVTASIGVDAFGALRELTDVTGTTVTLEPGRTDFHEVSAAAIGVPGGGVPGGVPYLNDLEPTPSADPGEVVGEVEGLVPSVKGLREIEDLAGGVDGMPAPPGCDQDPHLNPMPCYTPDYPDWVQHVQVPVAENHGAGNDMYSSMRYSSTLVTKAGVALQAGYSAGFEGGHSTAYRKEKTTNLAWANQGPDRNVEAILDTSYVRERAGVCWTDPDTFTRQCQLITSYRPDEAGGTTVKDRWTLNDRMDTAQDCWEPVDKVYEPVTKNETESSYSFRLGPGENWASTFGPQGMLYANTTITQQESDKKSFIRSWVITNSPTYRFHYVYVPNGKIGLDTQTTSNAACVRNRLNDVQTDAQNYNWSDPPPSDTVPAASTPPDPTSDENNAYHPVCGNMPDKCD